MGFCPLGYANRLRRANTALNPDPAAYLRTPWRTWGRGAWRRLGRFSSLMLRTTSGSVGTIRLSLAHGVAILCGFRTRDPWDGSRRRYRKATPKPQSNLILVLNLSLILSSINILLNILTLARHTNKQKIKFYLKSTKMPMIPPIFRVNHNYIRAQIFITRNNIVSY